MQDGKHRYARNMEREIYSLYTNKWETKKHLFLSQIFFCFYRLFLFKSQIYSECVWLCVSQWKRDRERETRNREIIPVTCPLMFLVNRTHYSLTGNGDTFYIFVITIDPKSKLLPHNIPIHQSVSNKEFIVLETVLWRVL